MINAQLQLASCIPIQDFSTVRLLGMASWVRKPARVFHEQTGMSIQKASLFLWQNVPSIRQFSFILHRSQSFAIALDIFIAARNTCDICLHPPV